MLMYVFTSEKTLRLAGRNFCLAIMCFRNKKVIFCLTVVGYVPYLRGLCEGPIAQLVRAAGS